MWRGTWVWLLTVLGFGAPWMARAQIDPVERRLIEAGYDQPFQGHGPLAAYGFFYYNQPGFYSTNLTLRMAVAPVYLDSELGLNHFLGPNTDLAFGLAGGGFADSYYEIRKGTFLPKESFLGDAAEVSSSIYHLFNPHQQIPLNLVFRVSARESFFRRDTDTADAFSIPDDLTTFRIRTGLRFGGQEPSLTEPLAMEVSLWHEAQFRLPAKNYGYNGDRPVEDQSQRVWARALLHYTTQPGEQSIQLGVTAGTTWDADRFSSYRLGGLLPFSSEFPLSIPGYFFQEISADRFALLNADYSFPLGPLRSWRIELLGASGVVHYLSGLEQPGDWHNGLGGGVTYISPSGSWLASVLYGHGFEALRSHGRGADQITLLFQYDFEAKARGKSRFFVPGATPYISPGVDQIFR
jgi:hypothetical protein